jgi:hypothetical protein
MPDFEIKFELLMPGMSKVNYYQIAVKAESPVEAMAKGIEEWRRATEPRDVRVKEIQKVA